MKVLVVGGAGYLGSVLVNRLRNAHVKVAVYDNLLYRGEYLEPIPFIYGDVRDEEKLAATLSDNYDVIIWLAAIVGDAACNLNPSQAIAINSSAVKFLVEHWRGKIIFASTASVYGQNPDEVQENAKLHPLSIYAESKAEAEKYLVDASSRALILRFGTLYGISPRMRFDLVVNVMSRDAAVKKSISVFGGSQYRPLLSVQDASRFIVAAIHHWHPGTYNLCGENAKIADVGARIAKVLSSDLDLVKTEYEDRRDYRMGMTETQEQFKPSFSDSIEAQAKAIAEHIQGGRIRDPYSSRYINAQAIRGNLWKAGEKVRKECDNV